VWRDLRYAVRQLRRSPVLTATAAVTLALGIGATTAVFTLIDQVMLRPLPVARPDQLWRIGNAVRCCYSTGYAQNDWSLFSWDAYRHFRGNTPAFEELAAFQVGQVLLAARRAGSSGPAEPRTGEYVSGNFFKAFGVSAWRGRVVTDVDDQPGAPPVAVMSFHTWQARYGSDSSVIGTTSDINGHAFTVIGVAPPGFFGAMLDGRGMPDFWLPLSTEPLIAGATARLDNPRVAWLDLIGRVRAGTQPQALEAQLQGELRQWLASHVADMTPQEKTLQARQLLRLTPGGAGVSLMRAQYEDGLRLLLLAAACVLLVACANIANLLLARGLKDRHQTALRAALGASRARLVRKALVESLVLSVGGAALGLAVAYAGAGLILNLVFSARDDAVPVDAAPSIPVLLFALAMSVATGVVFGIAPAWVTSRADPMAALHGASRSVRGNRHWVQRMLVIAQVAVSLVLLSAAAMLGRSLRNLEHQNLGFDTSGRYLVSINAMLSNYKQEQLAPIFRDVDERLRAIPGVRMASAALYAPMSGLYWAHDIRINGKPEPGPDQDVSSTWTRVTPGFFDAVGDRIVMGRPITDEDNANTRRVAVINEAFATRYFGKANPIGQHFGPAPRTNAAVYEIVGVASDMRYFANGSDAAAPIYFVPHAQGAHFDEPSLESREIWSHYPYNIVVWAPGNPRNLEVQVRTALADVAPGVVMYGVRPYAEAIHAGFAQENMIASLAWAFGAIALVLAAVGLYGVIAYGVEQRTSEIGVRMALGAKPGSVVVMVLRGAVWQVGIGLALGIPAAIGAGQVMVSRLFGVAPSDRLLLSEAALLLGLAAAVASFVPAWRAARVSPMRALRAE
jgi:putative ABC transport system permease protein